MAGLGISTRDIAVHQNRLENNVKEVNLDVEFSDYSQWQRKTLVQSEKKDTTQPAPGRHWKAQFTVGRIGSASTEQCRHKKKKDTSNEDEATKKQTERIKILQLRIKARRQCLEEYKHRKERIFNDNLELKSEIDKDEKFSHETVNEHLRKYEKYRDGISILNKHFVQDMDFAKMNLEEIKIRIDKEIKDLEKKVQDVDNRLQAKQNELYVLLNYKDKEYPVKAIKISDLQTEIENLKITNEEDTEDLDYIINTEIGKMRKAQHKIHTGITERMTEEAIGKMHPSLKDMALQNTVMKKEVEFHSKDIEELEVEITQIQDNIKQLLQSPKTNLRLQMFPEFFKYREKCTPDMDIFLDIPKQEWLPI